MPATTSWSMTKPELTSLLLFSSDSTGIGVQVNCIKNWNAWITRAWYVDIYIREREINMLTAAHVQILLTRLTACLTQRRRCCPGRHLSKLDIAVFHSKGNHKRNARQTSSYLRLCRVKPMDVGSYKAKAPSTSTHNGIGTKLHCQLYCRLQYWETQRTSRHVGKFLSVPLRRISASK